MAVMDHMSVLIRNGGEEGMLLTVETHEGALIIAKVVGSIVHG